tara:strand:+ start:792 stop:1271 length:480 start_codon:yes stop_codon:yes gene_type:complete
MSTLIRRAMPRGISRQEFLTPFDTIFDDMVSSMFPTFSNDLGDDFFARGSYPKVNVINNENTVEIEAAIPGMEKDEIEVSITDGILTIRGAGCQREGISDSQYVKREIKRSSFRRSFTLGENLDHSLISADFDKGILVLSIPKITPEEKKSKTMKINIT